RFASMTGEFLFGKIKNYTDDPCLSNKDTSVNLFQDEAGNFKIRVSNSFNVLGDDGIIGSMGPVTAEYNLVEKDGQWGYQLSNVTTEDSLILKMMQEKALFSADEIRMHCNPAAIQLEQERKQQLSQWQAACRSYEIELSNIVDSFIEDKNIRFKKPPGSL